jgi:arabinogalactan endo-1,4-beta-galactosidase
MKSAECYGLRKYFKLESISTINQKGYDATKAIDAKIKVIVHLDEGNNNQKIQMVF